MRSPRATAAARLLLPVPVLVALASCSSGSGGSDVGNQTPLPPVAEATVVGHPITRNGGDVSTIVRSGTEVILSAATSYGEDSPIIEFRWEPVNAAAQGVALIQRSTNTRSFTAPAVATTTTLQFRLTVIDTDNEQDTATVTVDVEPINDQNRYLTYLNVPTTFRVIASTSEALAADTPFTVDVTLRVTYPDRRGVMRTYQAVVDSATANWLLAQLPDPNQQNAAGNPRLTFRIPALDLDDINAAFLDLGPDDPLREQILEAFRVDQAVVEVLVTLDFPGGTGGDPSQAVLFVEVEAPGAVEDVLAKAGSSCQFTGAVQECAIPVENLSIQNNNAENAVTGDVYYTTIDPAGAKTTLSDWLDANCFDSQAVEYAADSHALYTNNFDLGFGRDMYLKRGTNCANGTLQAGELASVVINYPSLLLAAKKIDPIIAVAMEYAPPAQDPAAAPFAKFYVFAPDETTGDMARVASANFDGRGEKFVPGVCTVCHGGRPAATVTAGQDYPSFGNLGSIFMPWDIDSFLFSGPDGDPQKDPSLPPAGHPSLTRIDSDALANYTRAGQEAELRELNEAVLATYPPNSPVRELVHDWYSTSPNYASNTLSGTFRSDHVPPGWDVGVPGNSVQPRELYLTVIDQHCRACHTQLDLPAVGDPVMPGLTQSIPNFESYQAFIDTMTDPNTGNPTDTIIDPVFDQGVMPLARLTADRLWVPAATGERPADLLAAHLGVDATRVPGRPIATISSDMANYVRGDTVLLDGATGSRFVATYSWNLQHTPPALCPGPGQGFAGPPSLVGETTSNPSFNASIPGDYTIGLTVENEAGQSFDPTPLAIPVANLCPVAQTGVSTSIALGGANVQVDLNASGVADPGDLFGGSTNQFQLVAAVNVSASINAGVVTVSCGAGCVQSSAGSPPSYFDFRILDDDGDFDEARVTVDVTAAAQPTANNVSVTTGVSTVSGLNTNIVARTPNFTNTVSYDTLNVYNATSGGTGARTISVASSITTQNGTVVVLGDGQTVRYTPPQSGGVGFIGQDSFVYTVTDSNPATPQTAMATATVFVDGTISFDNTISPIPASGLLNCTNGCHDGFDVTATGFFDLSDTTNVNALWSSAVGEMQEFTRSGTTIPNLLFWPSNGTHLGSNSTWAPPVGGCNANSTEIYCTILRWGQEGLCRIDAAGQPLATIPACPP